MRQGTEDGRQGTETHKTGDIGWETKYRDVREGTKDVRQGQEKGTGDKREKTYLFFDPQTKYT
jgi:hypothetical protein